MKSTNERLTRLAGLNESAKIPSNLQRGDKLETASGSKVTVKDIHVRGFNRKPATIVEYDLQAFKADGSPLPIRKGNTSTIEDFIKLLAS